MRKNKFDQKWKFSSQHAWPPTRSLLAPGHSHGTIGSFLLSLFYLCSISFQAEAINAQCCLRGSTGHPCTLVLNLGLDIYMMTLVCCLHRRRASARNGAWWRDVTSRQPSMVMAFDRVSKHPDPYGGRVCSDLVHGRLVETCRVVAGRKKFPIDDIIGSRNDYTKHRGSTRHTKLILTAFPNV